MRSSPSRGHQSLVATVALSATLAASLALAGCGGGASAKSGAAATSATFTDFRATADPTTPAVVPAPAPAITVAPAPTTPAVPAFDPTTADRAMCQVTQDGGTFWIHISSAMDHNFLTCAGTALQADNLDTIFASGPNVDRRCLNPTASVDEIGALVGVYSSDRSADLAAARAFCSGNGWGND